MLLLNHCCSLLARWEWVERCSGRLGVPSLRCCVWTRWQHTRRRRINKTKGGRGKKCQTSGMRMNNINVQGLPASSLNASALAGTNHLDSKLRRTKTYIPNVVLPSCLFRRTRPDPLGASFIMHSLLNWWQNAVVVLVLAPNTTKQEKMRL